MSIEKARKVLAGHPYLKLAIVFGSVAHGQALRDSDIDIAVQADHHLSADEKSASSKTLPWPPGVPSTWWI